MAEFAQTGKGCGWQGPRRAPVSLVPGFADGMRSICIHEFAAAMGGKVAGNIVESVLKTEG